MMTDTVNGKVRARIWPRRRPSKPTKEQAEVRDKFAQAQRIARYVAPEMMAYIMKAVENSPLLPRDVLTMLAFNRWLMFTTEDGRSYWPMTARTDVSEALDVLGSTPGKVLRRGPQFWEAADPPESGGDYRLLRRVNLPANAASIDILDIPATFTDLRLVLNLRGTHTRNSVRVHTRFNGDSGFVAYSFSRSNRFGSTVNGAASSMDLMAIPSAGTDGSIFSAGDYCIPNYRDGDKWRTIVGTNYVQEGFTPTAEYIGGLWRNNARVERITLQPDQGLIQAGSTLALYGMR